MERPDNHARAKRHALGAIVACGVLCAVASAARAADRGQSPQAERRPLPPTVHGNLLVPVRQQLTLAYGLAQRSLRTVPGCSALFGAFGADGLALLASLEFDGATFEMGSDTCSRGGVAAFTVIRGKRIRLCPGFAVLTVPGAAVILIHEALHAAGMSERPVDPRGLAPQEINALVARSCNR